MVKSIKVEKQFKKKFSTNLKEISLGEIGMNGNFLNLRKKIKTLEQTS